VRDSPVVGDVIERVREWVVEIEQPIKVKVIPRYHHTQRERLLVTRVHWLLLKILGIRDCISRILLLLLHGNLMIVLNFFLGILILLKLFCFINISHLSVSFNLLIISELFFISN